MDLINGSNPTKNRMRKKNMSKKTTKKGKQTAQEKKKNEHTTDDTLVITRVIRAPPERVYKAFIDPDAMAKWLPPHGFTGKVTKMDARVGGEYHMTFTNFTTGSSHSFGGEFLELSPYTRIRYTDKFDDPNRPGEMETIIEFTKIMSGTEVKVTQKNIPSQIPLEFAKMGWQESIQLLEQLVVPEIPDAS